MRILLVTPPMTQLNTPYPATAYLTGCVRAHAANDVVVAQADLSIELFLRLFSRAGLTAVRERLERAGGGRGKRGVTRAASIEHFLAHADDYVGLVEPVLRFLQGRDPSLALRIVGRALLPEGPRFAPLDDPEDDRLAWAFGELGSTDRARHLASLFVDELADVVREGIDPRFELSRYGEKLAESAASFDALAEALGAPPTLVDEMLDALAAEQMRAHAPDVVGLTVPFPGNVYGALRIARVVKAEWPSAKVVLGGGYVNTELRQLTDPRVFDTIDYITLDDGERPMLALIEHLRDRTRPLFRTYVRDGGRVVLKSTPELGDLHHRETGTPTYDGLPLARYVSLFEMLNPMHRLWADGRWNKLTVARGCYWKKCTFCDVSLDYIARYETASADVTVDRIEALVRETGETGFHFVDEAAPPAALRALAEKIIERKLAITWWGNIRFEKSFTPALGRAARALGLRRGQRRARGGVGSAAGADEEGRDGRSGGARRACVQRRGRAGARVLDVRFSDRDRAGDRRRARARAPALRRGLHPVCVLAPLRRDRAQPDWPAPGAVRRAAGTGGAGDVRAQRGAVHRSDRLRPRAPGPGATQGDLQLHARDRPGGRRAHLVRRRRAGAARAPRAASEGAGAEGASEFDPPRAERRAGLSRDPSP